MTLETLVKIIGFAMTGVPLTVFIVISIFMFKGAAEDDDVVKSLVMLTFAIFAIGAVILALVYLTDIFVIGASATVF